MLSVLCLGFQLPAAPLPTALMSSSAAADGFLRITRFAAGSSGTPSAEEAGVEGSEGH